MLIKKKAKLCYWAKLKFNAILMCILETANDELSIAENDF